MVSGQRLTDNPSTADPRRFDVPVGLGRAHEKTLTYPRATDLAVWCCDPRTERWHELAWRHGRDVERPFDASALAYVRRLLVEAGMRRPSEEEVATGLARLLHGLSDTDLFRNRRARHEAVRQALLAEQRSARQPAAPPERDVEPPPPLPDAWAGFEIPKLELER